MSIFAPLGNTNVSRGHGVQNDVLSSNVTVNCDPRLVVPETAANIRNGLVKPEIAGKIAVEHDLCDLDVRNLTIHGTLIVPGDTVLSCTVIKADGAVCCPLTVENTNAQTSAQGGQVGNALCVKGSTLLQPLTDPANDGVGATNIKALLFLDGTLPDGTNFLSGDYMRIDARPLTTGNAIDIDISATGAGPTLVPMTGKGIRINKTGSSMENIATSSPGAPGARLLYIDAPTERGANFDIGQVPNVGDAVVLGEIAGPLLTDISTRAAVDGGPRKPPGLRGVRQSALYVNCVPGDSLLNPVGALWIDGGTVFSGDSTTDTDRGRLGPQGQILRLPSPLPIPQQPAGTPAGTYNNILLFSPGAGVGVSVDIVINPTGIVESVTIVNSGIGYNTGDLLIVGPGTVASGFPLINPAQTSDLVIDLNTMVSGGVVGNGQGHLHSRQVGSGGPLSPGLVALDVNNDPATPAGPGEELALFFGQKVDGGYNNPPSGPSYGTDVCGIIGFQTGGGTLAKIQVIYNTPYPEGTVPAVQLTPSRGLASRIFKNANGGAPPVSTEPQYLAVEYDTGAGLKPNEGFTIALTSDASVGAGINTGNVPLYIHYNVMAVIE